MQALVQNTAGTSYSLRREPSRSPDCELESVRHRHNDNLPDCMEYPFRVRRGSPGKSPATSGPSGKPMSSPPPLLLSAARPAPRSPRHRRDRLAVHHHDAGCRRGADRRGTASGARLTRFARCTLSWRGAWWRQHLGRENLNARSRDAVKGTGRQKQMQRSVTTSQPVSVRACLVAHPHLRYDPQGLAMYPSQRDCRAFRSRVQKVPY